MSAQNVTSAAPPVGTERVDLSALDDLNKPFGKDVISGITPKSKLLAEGSGAPFDVMWNGNPAERTPGISSASQTDPQYRIAELMSPEYAEGRKADFKANKALQDDYSRLGQTITDPTTEKPVVVNYDYIQSHSSSPSNFKNALPQSSLPETASETMAALYESSAPEKLGEYYDGTGKKTS